MKTTKQLFILITLILFATSCAKNDSSEDASSDVLSQINGDEGAQLTIEENNVKIISSGKNVIAFQTVAAFSPENTVRNLRVLSNDYPELNLWYVLGKNEDFVAAAVGVHRMKPSSLELTRASYQSVIYAECQVNENGTQRLLTGTIELRRKVESLGAVYDMVGILDLMDGNTKVTGIFWKKEVQGW